MKSLDEELNSLGTSEDECAHKAFVDPVFSMRLKAVMRILSETKQDKWFLTDTAVLITAVLENIDERYQQ